MLTFAENARFRRSTSVATSEVACETVVVPVTGEVGDLDAIFCLNEIGTDVWALMEQDRSLAELTTWYLTTTMSRAAAPRMIFVNYR